jgi:hypothetical protein
MTKRRSIELVELTLTLYYIYALMNKIKSKILQAILSVVYLYCSLLMPFFHLHDEDTPQSQGFGLFHHHNSSIELLDNDAPEYYHAFNNTEHSHHVSPHHLNVVIPNRNCCSVAVYNRIISYSLILDNHPNWSYFISYDEHILTLLDNYVHSASNISPPLS